MNLIKAILVLALFNIAAVSSGQTGQAKPNVIYEYKKYEKFDLGNLEVNGELTAPGEISVKERDREKFELDLFVRKRSDDLSKRDNESIH